MERKKRSVATKNSLSERDKQNLDIKWEDVKNGLSITVALRTNIERLYTGQTKHRVINNELRKEIVSLITDYLEEYYNKNPKELKTICDIVKLNAKARREGEKVRTAIVKNNITNWNQYKIKGYDPCTSKSLNDYKELYIVEGL